MCFSKNEMLIFETLHSITTISKLRAKPKKTGICFLSILVVCTYVQCAYKQYMYAKTFKHTCIMMKHSSNCNISSLFVLRMISDQFFQSIGKIR